MDGVGQPDLLLPPGASPHGYSMRPSEAQALDAAEIVFWVGEGLTPWLERPLDTLAADAEKIELLEVEKVEVLALREGALMELHEDEHDHHNQHGHDDHDHRDMDPHAWLDPDNAVTWLAAIADALSEADPANAPIYATNAALGQEEIAALTSKLAARLEPLRDRRFILFHDGYQYFEHSFGLTAAGAISMSDASDPGAARIAELQHVLEEQGISCIFTEPQFNAGIADTLADGRDVTVTLLDPLGAALTPGPALYPDLLSTMGESFATCLE